MPNPSGNGCTFVGFPLVDVLQRLFDGVGQAVEDLVLVDRPVRAAFA